MTVARPIERPEFRAKLGRMISYAAYVRNAHERGHTTVSAADIAADFSISPQQVEAELNSLATCGSSRSPLDFVEINYDFSDIQFTDAQGLDRSVPLTHSEAEALLLLMEILEDTPGVVPLADIRSAQRKLLALTGRDTSVRTGADAPGNTGAHTREILNEAFKKSRKVSFQYFSRNTNRQSLRRVSPVSTFEYDGEFYFYGFDHSVRTPPSQPRLSDLERGVQAVANPGAPRTFHVAGMSEVKLLDLRANVPAWLEKPSAVDPFSKNSATLHATVLIAPDAAWLFTELGIAPTGAAPGPDGREWMEGALPVLSEEWLIRFTMEQSGRLVVTSPPQVAEAVAARARSALAAYGDVEDDQ